MDTIDPTRANAALWRNYAEKQWAPWLTPFGGPAATFVIAESIARAYAAVWGPVVDALFAENAPAVSRFVEDDRAAERAAAVAAAEEAMALGQPMPDWLTAQPDTTTATPYRREAALV